MRGRASAKFGRRGGDVAGAGAGDARYICIYIYIYTYIYTYICIYIYIYTCLGVCVCVCVCVCVYGYVYVRKFHHDRVIFRVGRKRPHGNLRELNTTPPCKQQQPPISIVIIIMIIIIIIIIMTIDDNNSFGHDGPGALRAQWPRVPRGVLRRELWTFTFIGWSFFGMTLNTTTKNDYYQLLKLS